MKFKEKISWLMGRLQRQLFPCLEECYLYFFQQKFDGVTSS